MTSHKAPATEADLDKEAARVLLELRTCQECGKVCKTYAALCRHAYEYEHEAGL